MYWLYSISLKVIIHNQAGGHAVDNIQLSLLCVIQLCRPEIEGVQIALQLFGNCNMIGQRWSQPLIGLRASYIECAHLT